MAEATGTDGPPPALRPAGPGDEALLLALFRSARPELELLPLPPEHVEAMIGLQLEAQRSGYRASYPEAIDWVIEQEDRPVGRLLVDAGPPLTVVDLAVLPEHRGVGAATGALRLVLADADARGVPARLRVRGGNPAQRLYERLGFVVDRDEPDGPAGLPGPHGDLAMVRPPGGGEPRP